MPQPGEVWLADIPFTSGVASKLRPVLVLWTDAADVVVAAVTSAQPRSTTDVALQNWSAAGLRVASTVRLSRLDCLEQHLLRRRLGFARKRRGTVETDLGERNSVAFLTRSPPPRVVHRKKSFNESADVDRTPLQLAGYAAGGGDTEVQRMHRRAAHGGPSFNLIAIEPEVFRPNLPDWLKIMARFDRLPDQSPQSCPLCADCTRDMPARDFAD